MLKLRQRVFTAILLACVCLLLSGPGFAKQRYHKVYKGQRLASIAKRYNVSIDALCHANDISRKDTIRPGQQLIIPDRSDKTGEKARAERDEAEESKADKKASKAARREADDEKSSSKKSSGKASKTATKAPEKTKKRSRKTADPKVHKVARGQRLASIAKRYRITLDALTYANDLDPKDPIKPGQMLVIPSREDEAGEEARRLRARGHVDGLKTSSKSKSKSKSRSRSKSHDSWKRYSKRPKKRGYVNLRGFGESWRGYVIARRGRLNPGARRAITRVLGGKSLAHGIHPRLIELIAKVSDQFGGRTLRIVSGHREKSYAKASRHTLGRAVDFSIPGVPNEALRDYLLTFDDVGVGYYPNSSFVHLDVREHKTFWIDHSGPGEAPRYSYIGKGPPQKK